MVAEEATGAMEHGLKTGRSICKGPGSVEKHEIRALQTAGLNITLIKDKLHQFQ